MAETDAVDEPLRPAAPDRHLLGSYLQHSAANQYSALLESMDVKASTRLTSAAGPTAGSSFVAQLSTHGVHYTDRQFEQAVRWRLGMLALGPVRSCLNTKADGEVCGEALDQHADHAVICPCGPMRVARHNGLAVIYADIVEEIGGVARREVFVPEFSAKGEAWLDV